MLPRLIWNNYFLSGVIHVHYTPFQLYLLNILGEFQPGILGYLSKRTAIERLKELTGQDFGDDVSKWENWALTQEKFKKQIKGYRN
jgi:hypothetical protein